MPEADQWSRWMLETRFGGDANVAKAHMYWLYGVRDKVLHYAQLRYGDVLLDVGSGDGLIGFRALERVGMRGHVVFCDISQPLLDHTEAVANKMGVRSRCSFVHASADNLYPTADQSIDVVTTRSVLIYVVDKAAALREFYRVLRPGGRVSLFEPINRLMAEDWSETRFAGHDVTPIADLWGRVRAFYQRLQPDTDPMLDFDEQDLLRNCEAAGFTEVHLELRVDIAPTPPSQWDLLIDVPANPRVPPMRAVISQLFTSEEAAQFEGHVRPLVETGQGMHRRALAFVWATKGKDALTKG